MSNNIPNFFILGTAKSGTTSLFHVLKEHPQISVPENKETYFFGEYFYDTARVEKLADYLACFPGRHKAKAIGEVATAYLYSSQAVKQIFNYNPEAGIIIFLRNPIDRAFSNYLYKIKTGTETLSFEAALEAESKRIKENWPYGFHYAGMGLYFRQVERCLSYFDRSQVRIFLFEDLKNNSQQVFKEIFGLLGVDGDISLKTTKIHNKSGRFKSKLLMDLINRQLPVKEPLKWILPLKVRKPLRDWLREINISSKKPKMREETRQNLREFYRKDVEALSELIGRDLGCWLE